MGTLEGGEESSGKKLRRKDSSRKRLEMFVFQPI
jgi:hypothetical protein